MSNGYEKIGLDYKFLNSEESFYRKYKEAVREHLLALNEWNGIFPYSEGQINVLDKKIERLKTPFRIVNSQGLANLRSWYVLEYPYFFVLLAFVLACSYAKDSASGVNELTLASFYGRKKDMKAKWIAGNLFTATAYLLFTGTLVIEHGAIASLHGWNESAQVLWFECLYNINLGTGLLIMMLGGLLGALVIGSFIMLISLKTKSTKLTAVISVAAIWLLIRLSATYSQIKLLLNPIQFKSDSLVTQYLFIGTVAVPYFIVTLILAVFYITILKLLMRSSYKKYCLN